MFEHELVYITELDCKINLVFKKKKKRKEKEQLLVAFAKEITVVHTENE